MNMDDAGRIAELMPFAYIAVASSHYEGDYQLVVDYADLKPHRSTGLPRTQKTHIDALNALMAARGFHYALGTAVSPYEGLQRLVFTKARERETR